MQAKVGPEAPGSGPVPPSGASPLQESVAPLCGLRRGCPVAPSSNSTAQIARQYATSKSVWRTLQSKPLMPALRPLSSHQLLRRVEPATWQSLPSAHSHAEAVISTCRSDRLYLLAGPRRSGREIAPSENHHACVVRMQRICRWHSSRGLLRHPAAACRGAALHPRPPSLQDHLSSACTRPPVSRA